MPECYTPLHPVTHVASVTPDREWYALGAATIINVFLADSLFVNIFIEGVRIFDVQPARQLLARIAPNQQLMNEAYALDNPRYLPFRLQLVLKFIFLGLVFSSAVPILYFIMALFMWLSWYIDQQAEPPPPRRQLTATHSATPPHTPPADRHSQRHTPSHASS